MYSFAGGEVFCSNLGFVKVQDDRNNSSMPLVLEQGRCREGLTLVLSESTLRVDMRGNRRVCTMGAEKNIRLTDMALGKGHCS